MFIVLRETQVQRENAATGLARAICGATHGPRDLFYECPRVRSVAKRENDARECVLMRDAISRNTRRKRYDRAKRRRRRKRLRTACRRLSCLSRVVRCSRQTCYHDTLEGLQDASMRRAEGESADRIKCLGLFVFFLSSQAVRSVWSSTIIPSSNTWFPS